jgi:hypothetical protein
MKLTGFREQILDRTLAIKLFSCPPLPATFDALRNNGQNVKAVSTKVRRSPQNLSSIYVEEDYDAE